MTNIEVRDKFYEIASSKAQVLDRVIFNLVPVGFRNRKGGIITKPVADNLELQFKIDISDVMADSSIVIFEDMRKLSGVSRDDIYDAALYNTERSLPPRFDSISELLGVSGFEDLPMYVLTNERQVYGAGAILYDGMYEKLSRILGDFIVIPSSVHEMILIPSMYESPYITKIIREVNETVVAPGEVLGTRPYKLTPSGELVEI